MKHKVKHVHFVGIGGAGMSGIAEVLLTLRYKVSGSDLAETTATRRLRQLGAKIHIGHAAEHIAGADAVVISSAVKDDNPEVVAARAGKIPVVPRALMLAELMRLQQGIAVAGTHGKTTTTSLVASVLAEGGLDPTFVIGGRLEAAGSNARLGAGEFIVVEADESDASFLYLQPVLAVVTNIDADHMETYEHSMDRLRQAFVDFLQRLPFYGVAVLCADDPNVRAVMPQLTKPITTYGLAPDAHVRALDVTASGGQMRFRAAHAGDARTAASEFAVTLNLPGAHNVRNALAAIAVGIELGVPEAAIVEGARRVQGRGPALPEPRQGAARGRRQLHAGGRLRPPSRRDGGDARRRARRVSRAPRPARVPAAPLHAHPRLLRGFREGAVHRRRAGADRGLRGRRGADRGRGRQGARARDPRAGQGRAGVRGEDRRPAGRDTRRGARRRRGADDGRGLDRQRGGAAREPREKRERRSMNMAETKNLAAAGLRGELKAREPMARHVSWRAGGAASARTRRPTSTTSRRSCARCRATEPVHFVGLGSNLLVRDGGLRGTVIFTHRALRDIRVEREAGALYAQAGVASPKVARFAAMHDLAGAEFLAGIPGTVGGALAMNAGCYGGETWNVVAQRDDGRSQRRRCASAGPGDYEIGYRHVRLKAQGGDRRKGEPSQRSGSSPRASAGAGRP